MQKKTTTKQAATSHDARHTEITRLLRGSLDTKRPRISLSYQGSIVVRRAVTRLVNLAGTRRRKAHAETFTLAVEALAREGVERSRAREAELQIATLLRWLRAAASGNAEPAPEPKPAPAPRRQHAKRRRGFRRIPVNTTQLVNFGVELKDTATVALGCDVRVGEFGYLCVSTQFSSGSYKTLEFMFEPDRECVKWADKATTCVRHTPNKCGGIHSDDVETLGRVVGFERKGQALETTIELRPYDEREQAESNPWLEVRGAWAKFISEVEGGAR
jgi:hypothetical protein